MELFGEDFENLKVPEEADEEAESTTGTPAARADKAKKGKIAAKATGHTYQFQIMESIDVPRSEIKKFADPYHWLTYFPPIAIVCYTLPIYPMLQRTYCLIYAGRQPCTRHTR